MSVCSSSSCDKPKTVKRECPVCQQLCLDVQKKTILQHVKEAWLCDLSALELIKQLLQHIKRQKISLLRKLKNQAVLVKQLTPRADAA